MSGAAGRRPATASGQDAAQSIRFAIVALCVLGTACAYVGCIVVVLGGHIEALFSLIPWLAATALGTILVVTICALVGASRERLQNRRLLTAERISALASAIRLLDLPERASAEKQLIDRLDVTFDALSEVVKTNPGVKKELVAGGVAARVERELESSAGKWHRVSAAGVLGLLGSETSVGPLKRALDDPDSDVAYAAAQALARYSSPTAYAALLFALTKQRLPAARIASLLEAFRCPMARELIERRADSENPRVRYWVAYLLGSLADARSAPVAYRLAGDPVENVRANAAEALASFPNHALLSRLLADESWVVRSHAAKAAGACGASGLAARLAELLEDRSWWVRQNATLALAGFGDAAVPWLLAQLRSDDRFARNKAGEALVRSGYASDQIERVKSGLPGSQEARQVLVDLGRAEALSTIENAARTTSDAEARRRLVTVLEDIGTEQANAVLERLGEPAGPGLAAQLKYLEQLAELELAQS
jgi:HEAT repeat protein